MFAPHPEPPLWAWLLFGAFEFAIRVVALGVVPKHRRASTSTAWLLLIFLWPLLGVPLYVIFGSWWAMGRRLDDDPEASQLVLTSGAMAQSGELFVLDMGRPVKIRKAPGGGRLEVPFYSMEDLAQIANLLAK